MKAWTDYPFTELGDISYQIAPVRRITVLSYDGNKYCRILVCGIISEVKLGYIYENPTRLLDGHKHLRAKRKRYLESLK